MIRIIYMLSYPKECIRYVRQHLSFLPPTLDKVKHPFLDKLFDTIKSTHKEYPYTVTETFIPKLHSENENPVLYHVLKEKCPKHRRFEVWMNEEATNMDYLTTYAKANKYIAAHYGETVSKQRHTLNTILYKNLFISLDCQQYMEICDLYQFVFEFKELGITIVLYNRLQKHNVDVQSIVHLVQIIRGLKQRNEAITIYVLCTEQRKMLVDEFSGLGPVHVNSGMSMDHTLICVWRLEELYKVLIHELIHYHQLDFRNDSSEYDKYDARIRQTLQYEGTNYLFEAYTEFLTVIIHSMWLTYWIEDDYLESFYDILNNELRFQKLQNKKILDWYNVTCLGQKTIRTFTSVVSYYFLKHQLFEYFLDIISKLDKQIHIDQLYILRLIDACAKKLSQQTFDHIQIAPETNLFMAKTMRMTAYSP